MTLLMVNAVFTWRCKCGVRVKVVGETDPGNPPAQSMVKCPACCEEQVLAASKVSSVTQEIASRHALPHRNL